MSKIEVNQISSQCGSTLTVGQSGDTVTLASGASQTGFGRTGTVDWDTTAKTASFTAVSGNGYFVNTTSTAITVTLPAGSSGSIVSLKDYANTWNTNNVTVTPDGTDKINGANANATLDTQDQSVTLVYVDSTKGWRVVQDSTSDVSGTTFVTATGGTETTCGDYKIHTFTGPGTFTVTCAGNAAGSNTVDYLVVAGGAAGGAIGAGGGGGAGGYRFSDGTASGCYTAGPAPLGASALPVSAQGYPITVGGGGSPCGGSSPTGTTNGSNSIFSTITSTGGGKGGYRINPGKDGSPGGSGGGAGGHESSSSGGTGNTPSVTPPQGNDGGDTNNSPSSYHSAGGGGAGGAGTTAPNPGSPPTATGNPGGAGLTSCITASPVTRAGGGGGASRGDPGEGGTTGAPGGSGGGGQGAGTQGNAGAGSTNTGSGGGGGGYNIPSSTGAGSGGSGIVIIRYKFQ